MQGLVGDVWPRLPTAARGWLAAAVDRPPSSPRGLAAALASATRKVPASALERCRIALIVAAADAAPDDERPFLLAECFRTGDNAEKCAVLRALPFLPQPQSLVEVGVQGCRTNARDVFEAICTRNRYPAEWFPEPSFNQMVLKAYFMGVPVSGIVGLERRLNAELARMAADYAAERRAAGRAVPPDIDEVLR
jgi:hypothetical protein